MERVEGVEGVREWGSGEWGSGGVVRVRECKEWGGGGGGEGGVREWGVEK